MGLFFFFLKKKIRLTLIQRVCQAVTVVTCTAIPCFILQSARSLIPLILAYIQSLLIVQMPRALR